MANQQQEDTVTDAADDWAAALAEQASTGDTTADADNLFAKAADPKPATGLFQQFGSSVASGTQNDIDMILDIPVQLTVELGRTKIPIKHILQLAQGSVIELDGLAGEPMDVLVNGYLIAQGEVVVVNDKFGIRLTDIITPSERLRKLNR
jgi:flagellar motor switch protein FliN